MRGKRLHYVQFHVLSPTAGDGYRAITCVQTDDEDYAVRDDYRASLTVLRLGTRDIETSEHRDRSPTGERRARNRCN